MQSAKEACPACCNLQVRFLLVPMAGDDFDLQEYPCPICCSSSYPNGYLGETMTVKQEDGTVTVEWIIPPYGPGEKPVYVGLKNGFPEEAPGV